MPHRKIPNLGCYIEGDYVTPYQANEVLVRTCDFIFNTKDDGIRKTLEDIFYSSVSKEDWGDLWWISVPGETLIDNLIREDRMGQYRKEMGVLDLPLLYNERVCSSRIGGLYGWCDWDGRICERGRNVGESFTIQGLLKEWSDIASAFPFLNLTCKVLEHMAGCREGELESSTLIIKVVYEVSKGEVIERFPDERDYLNITPLEETIDIDHVIRSKEYLDEVADLERWEVACRQVATSQFNL